MGIAATRAVEMNHAEKAPLESGKDMEKFERGSSDIIIESNSNITFVRWKDNKVVKVVLNLYGQSPMKKDISKVYQKVYQRKTW